MKRIINKIKMWWYNFGIGGYHLNIYMDLINSKWK